MLFVDNKVIFQENELETNEDIIICVIEDRFDFHKIIKLKESFLSPKEIFKTIIKEELGYIN